MLLEFTAGDCEVGAFGIAPLVELATGSPDAPVTHDITNCELNQNDHTLKQEDHIKDHTLRARLYIGTVVIVRN